MKQLFFLLILTTLFTKSFAQTTAYEKKCYALTVQFYRQLGIDESMLKKTSKLSDLEELSQMSFFARNLGTERGVLLLLEYQKAIKEAEKLKTEVDFQRDKEREKKAQIEKEKLELEKQKRELAEKEKIQRELAEKEMQEKIRKENEKMEEEKVQKDKELRQKINEVNLSNNVHEKSDYVQLQKHLKAALIDWNKRKEFETKEKYETRISNTNNKEYKDIIRTVISDSKWCYFNSIIACRLNSYNIESETFSLTINYDDSYFNIKWKENNLGTIFSDTITLKIPNTIAESLMKHYSSKGSNILAYILDVKMMNNNWHPTKIIFVFPENSEDINRYHKDTHIEEMKSDRYKLGFSFNYSIKPIKLKDISTQYKGNNLGSSVYFYLWQNNIVDEQKIQFNFDEINNNANNVITPD